MKTICSGLAALTLWMMSASAQVIWVNEFHYDNAAADLGEFVELAVPSSFNALSTATLTLYNGNDGASYDSHTLDTFTVGGTLGGYTFYSKLITGIQNGAPDGFAVDVSGTVLQFLSYEGTFAATSGPAVGLNSVNIGVSESDPGTPVGSSLGLSGTGSSYADFTWTVFAINTPGLINTGQTLTPVPEPREYALIAGAGLLGFSLIRRQLLKRA